MSVYDVLDAIIEENHVAEGRMDGRSYVHLYGRNPSVSSGTVPEDVWNVGGVYAGFSTEVETLSIVSTSTADDIVGTGTRTVRVYGLDANYDAQEEDVDLDGTTPVTTVNTYLRCWKVLGIASGTGGTNAGDITINHSTTTANVFGKILAGKNTTHQCIYTVPAGFTAYVVSYEAAMLDNGSNRSIMTGYSKDNNGNELEIRPFIITTTYNSSFHIHGGLPIPEKTDLAMRVSSVSGSNADITGSFEIRQVRNF